MSVTGEVKRNLGVNVGMWEWGGGVNRLIYGYFYFVGKTRCESIESKLLWA